MVVFQVLTFYAVTSGVDNPQFGVLVGLNLLFFAAMIPYAKWVGKLPTHQKALLQLAKHEIILLGLSVAAMLLAMLLRYETAKRPSLEGWRRYSASACNARLINRKTAKAIGLTLPPSLLLRADKVIQ